MMRWLNRLTTLLTVLVLVAGPPAVGIVWLLRQPWSPPSTERVRAWLQEPPPETIVILLLAAVAAMLWLLITATTLRLLAPQMTHGWRRLRRLPLPTPAQATASTLAGTAILGFPTLGAAPDTPRPAPLAGAGADHGKPAAIPYARPHEDAADGVALADGSWIPPHHAETVAAMVGLLWLRRRQTYHPGTPAQRDPAPVLPPAATAITATTPHPADPLAGNAVDVLAANQLPTDDITLTGPGAHSAARGLLVTALMTNTTVGRPRAHIVITPDDLHTLLGPIPAAPPQIPGLHVTSQPGTVTARLQPVAADANGEPQQPVAPPRVLYLRGLQPGPSTEVADASMDAAAFTAVVFGAAATGGATWQVRSDGTLISAPHQPGRLCVLSPQTASDLLHLISQAHGHTPTSPATASIDAEQPTQTGTDLADRVSVPPVTLSVLGDCRLTVHDHTVPIRRSAAWQTLVLLAAHPDGATGRHLTETIWPGLPPATITHRLYTTLSDLRTQLKPIIDQTLITHHHDRYLLDPTVVDVDLWHLQTAARAATHAITTIERHHSHRQVIARYHGELAAGHTWPWLPALRETIRHQVISAYADLTDDLPAAEALALLREAITVDPYNEDLHHRTISALIAIGDHPAATRLYHTYTHRLTVAGLTPSTHLNDLVIQISLQS